MPNSSVQFGFSICRGRLLPGRAGVLRFGQWLLAGWLASHGGSLAVAQSPAPTPAAPSAATSAQDLAAAQDATVWGGLVYASNEKADKAEADPKEFPRMAERLAKIFPYSRFQLMGQHAQVVFREYESWVVPSREVFLKLDSKGPADGGGINLHLQFWQGQQVLVKTDAVLREGKPLVIGGPKWRGGQVIFLLNLQKVESAAHP